MRRLIFLSITVLYFMHSVYAQWGVELNKTVKISGYADLYYGYDFLKPKDDTEPYVYSSTKHNELDINMAFIKIEFNSSRSRAVFSPAIGTLMEINYAQEPPFWQHVNECYAGIRPVEKLKWWVDAGVFGAPYTNESVISMDHITYTRSLGSENSPYYVSGMRSIHNVSERWKLTLYYLNGWQRIRKINEQPAFGHDLQYKAGRKWVFNWTGFAGDSRFDSSLHLRQRVFSDIHGVYNMDGKLSASFCLSAGSQNFMDSGVLKSSQWGSAAFQARWRFSPGHAAALKYDNYLDPHGVILTNITGNKGVVLHSFTANYTREINSNTMFRLEGRYLTGKKPTFLDHRGNAVGSALNVVASVAVRF